MRLELKPKESAMDSGVLRLLKYFYNIIMMLLKAQAVYHW